ncbi:MAG: dockerin type I repeat-containing protein, partial [Clostridia bacterium]|nr:dockerin type I repeat-containing protein [Clostridia bacterium]
ELLKAKEITFVMGNTPSDWGVGSDGASITEKREKLNTAEDFSKEATKTYSGITSGASMFIDSSSTPAGVNGNGTVDFEFAEPKKVEMITVTSGRTQNISIGIKLYGSATGEEGSYTELINEQNVNYQWTQYVRPFKVAEPAEYKYYRLEFSGSGSFQIGEVELLGNFHEYEEIIAGDIDADGDATVIDALAVLRISLGLRPVRDAVEVADMDADGAITVSDVLLIMKKAARLI